MNKKLLAIIILTIIVGIWLILNSDRRGTLVNPQTSMATPAPPQAPKTFKFDRSTDLKLELEKINPEVLDSDFE